LQTFSASHIDYCRISLVAPIVVKFLHSRAWVEVYVAKFSMRLKQLLPSFSHFTKRTSFLAPPCWSARLIVAAITANRENRDRLIEVRVRVLFVSRRRRLSVIDKTLVERNAVFVSLFVGARTLNRAMSREGNV
jgi:hypothetical protein